MTCFSYSASRATQPSPPLSLSLPPSTTPLPLFVSPSPSPLLPHPLSLSPSLTVSLPPSISLPLCLPPSLLPPFLSFPQSLFSATLCRQISFSLTTLKSGCSSTNAKFMWPSCEFTHKLFPSFWVWNFFLCRRISPGSGWSLVRAKFLSSYFQQRKGGLAWTKEKTLEDSVELVRQNPQCMIRASAEHKDVVLLANTWQSVAEESNYFIHPWSTFPSFCGTFLFSIDAE